MKTTRATTEIRWMRAALRLAQRAYGDTSPNPLVGAVLVKRGKVIGQGWHRAAGQPHAEIEALRDCEKRGHSPRGATLYVTLEPCCTHGRTPPCTEEIIASGVKQVVVAATDPNPEHAGRGFKILEKAGVKVSHGLLADEANQLNEAFNHWIVQRTPFVTVKAAMTLDGKIATASGDSKWITGTEARGHGMHLRRGADAILVGIETILADNPSLTIRSENTKEPARIRPLRRIILDTRARTPLKARVATDEHAAHTIIVVGDKAPATRVAALTKRVTVWSAPLKAGRIDLRLLLKKLGQESVTQLLVEGGGEVNASFLLQGLAQRVAFFYAPKILGGSDARRSVAGDGVQRIEDMIQLSEVEWRSFGADLMLTARVR